MMFFTSCNDDNLTGGHPPEEDPEKTNTPTIGMAIDPPPAPTPSSPLSYLENEEKEKSRLQIEELMNQDSQLKKIIEELAQAEKARART
ncbi:hypothetical protein DM812_02955 (plasmid) [Blattabacterium punctulatus]|nr:hypothetical protein DM812_02955 [Blattabacterium punctulatus]